MLPHDIQIQLHLPHKYASQHFIYGNLHLSVHQGITRAVHRCKYLDHAATFCSTLVMFFMKITHQLNITKANSHLNLASRQGMKAWTYTCCHITFNTNHIFLKRYASPDILSEENFHSMFTKELHGEVHRHKYLYCDVIPHLKCNSLNLVCEATFWKVIFTYFMHYNFQAHFWECTLYSSYGKTW